MKKILFTAILALTLSSCVSNDTFDNCMEINAKYDRMVGQANGDNNLIRNIEESRNKELKESSCIK